jgi:hypothetical protein
VFQGVLPLLLVGVNDQALGGTLPSYCDAMGDLGSTDEASFQFLDPVTSEVASVNLLLP